MALSTDILVSRQFADSSKYNNNIKMKKHLTKSCPDQFQRLSHEYVVITFKNTLAPPGDQSYKVVEVLNCPIDSNLLNRFSKKDSY